jgi:UDP-GlcNAc:undecaprenyl-phosphate GlcNAc-1-phosphate transferase
MIVNNFNFFLILFYTFAVTVTSIWFALRFNLSFNIQDKPNKRSLHNKSLPRTGGIIFIPIILLVWFLAGIDSPLYLSFTIISLMAISFLDDIHSISAAVRFIFHIISILIFVLYLDITLNFFNLGIIVLFLVWMSNLFNFMDGSDGMAAGMAVIGFFSYAIASYMVGDFSFALENGIIMMCSLGFLFFNFSPAKIFMGDVGSISLGFLAGAMGIIGWQKEIWALWFPLLIFSPFIIDATTTLLKRILKREKFWQAHREHYYQRLVLLGWSHKKTALVFYIVMICLALISFYINNYNNKFILVIILFFYCLPMIYIDRIWKEYLLNNRSSDNK